jgi:hypothetical protein
MKIDVDLIIEFEKGTQDWDDTLTLFSQLVKTGTAYKLQGAYGRFANGLINRGWLSETGEILKRHEEN